jgi:ActR/RegA family two-component response regulator
MAPTIAAVELALRAGADDYLANPVIEAELTAALLGRTPTSPSIPETPLAWKHSQRIVAHRDCNLSETARLWGMGRRSLRRILSKRAPHLGRLLRACPYPSAPASPMLRR